MNAKQAGSELIPVKLGAQAVYAKNQQQAVICGLRFGQGNRRCGLSRERDRGIMGYSFIQSGFMIAGNTRAGARSPPLVVGSRAG